MTRHRKYNAEQLEFIRQNQEGITRQALADLLKESTALSQQIALKNTASDWG